MPRNRTTYGLDFVVPPLSREAGPSLRGQLEEAVRVAIRQGRLRANTALPSSRALAEDLGVSRGVVVEAYAQLTAEGYLTTRPGAATRVAAPSSQAKPEPKITRDKSPVRFDFLPGIPDLEAFPMSDWVAAIRQAAIPAPASVMGYGDPRGAETLRTALVEYLGRVRGVSRTNHRSWSAPASLRASGSCAGSWPGVG